MTTPTDDPLARIAELEGLLREVRGLLAECLALNPTVIGDMEKIRVWLDVIARMKAEAALAAREDGDAK